MRLLFVLILVIVAGCTANKAVYFEAKEQAHGTVEFSIMTQSFSVDINGPYRYCAVPMERLPVNENEQRRFADTFVEFCARAGGTPTATP